MVHLRPVKMLHHGCSSCGPWNAVETHCLQPHGAATIRFSFFVMNVISTVENPSLFFRFVSPFVCFFNREVYLLSTF